MCIAKDAIVATCFAILLGVVIGSIIYFLHQNSPDDDETTRLSTLTRILQEYRHYKPAAACTIIIKPTVSLALEEAVMEKSLLLQEQEANSRNSSGSISRNSSTDSKSTAEALLINVCKKLLRSSIDDLRRCNYKLSSSSSSSSTSYHSRWDLHKLLLDDIRTWLSEAQIKQQTCMNAINKNSNKEEEEEEEGEGDRKGEKIKKILEKLDGGSKILSFSPSRITGFSRRRLLSHKFF